MTATDTNKRPLGSRWCSIGSMMTGLGLFLVVIGIGGAATGLLGPMAAFSAFGLGALLAAISLLLLLIGLLLSKGSGGAVAAGRAWGAWVAAALLIGFSMSQRPNVEGAPPIHDVSTNIDDAPAFVALVAIRADDEAQNPPEYTGEFADQQQAAFPDLKTVEIAADPATVFAAAEQVATELGWEIAAADSSGGLLEATDATNWFRFRDDVVVRVRAGADGSLVDVRSKSRVGRGDMGANAARIREFISRLEAAT